MRDCSLKKLKTAVSISVAFYLVFGSSEEWAFHLFLQDCGSFPRTLGHPFFFAGFRRQGEICFRVFSCHLTGTRILWLGLRGS